jgi:hypothetical protein
MPNVVGACRLSVIANEVGVSSDPEGFRRNSGPKWTAPVVIAPIGDAPVTTKRVIQTRWERDNDINYNPDAEILGPQDADYHVPDACAVADIAEAARDRAFRPVLSDYDSSTAEIPVGLLTVEAYQRTPDDSRGDRLLRRMRNGFDSDIFGMVTVNFRLNEKGIPVFSLMDGRGRATWVLRAFGPEMTVPANLYYNVPRHIENKFYEAQESSKRRALTVNDLMRSKVDRQDDDALEIIKVVDDLGLNLDLSVQRHGQGGGTTMSAVDTIVNVHQTCGPEILRDTLRTAYEVWGDGPNTFSTNIVGSLATFLKLYQGDDRFNYKRLVKQLKAVKNKDGQPGTAKDLETIAYSRTGSRSRVNLSGVILEMYNARLATDNKLPTIEVAQGLLKERQRQEKRAAKKEATN